MDVSRGHLFLAGGVVFAAVVAGVLATTADASQAGDAAVSAITCDDGYTVAEVRDITLVDGRVGTAQICAKVTGEPQVSSSASTAPSGPPSMTTAATTVASPRVTDPVASPRTTAITSPRAPGAGASPRVTVTVVPPRVRVTVAPARTVRVTVTVTPSPSRSH